MQDDRAGMGKTSPISGRNIGSQGLFHLFFQARKVHPDQGQEEIQERNEPKLAAEIRGNRLSGKQGYGTIYMDRVAEEEGVTERNFTVTYRNNMG